MSRDAAIAFLSKVRDDAALQAQLRKLDPKDLDGLVAAAKAAGFAAFSKADYLSAAKVVGGEWLTWAAKLQAEPTTELSEADLEHVAGGKGGPFVHSACGLTLQGPACVD